jgi:predicted Zn-ribbon and HTH transcriptional regulator
MQDVDNRIFVCNSCGERFKFKDILWTDDDMSFCPYCKDENIEEWMTSRQGDKINVLY